MVFTTRNECLQVDKHFLETCNCYNKKSSIATFVSLIYECRTKSSENKPEKTGPALCACSPLRKSEEKSEHFELDAAITRRIAEAAINVSVNNEYESCVGSAEI